MVPPLAPPGYESDMSGFAATLNDADIWAVLAYIKSRWPAEIRARQQALNGG
jgi:mono/diheme cytochrome c family protein